MAPKKGMELAIAALDDGIPVRLESRERATVTSAGTRAEVLGESRELRVEGGEEDGRKDENVSTIATIAPMEFVDHHVGQVLIGFTKASDDVHATDGGFGTEGLTVLTKANKAKEDARGKMIGGTRQGRRGGGWVAARMSVDGLGRALRLAQRSIEVEGDATLRRMLEDTHHPKG